MKKVGNMDSERMDIRAHENEIAPGETIIPLVELERSRKCIEKALTPEKSSEVTVEYQGEIRKNTWTFSVLHPGPSLDALGHLEMMPGWSLVGAAERLGGNGNGVVFSVQEGEETAAIEWLSKSCESGQVSLQELIDGNAKPPGSISVVMNTFTGPPTAESFVQASLMWRELLEYGAAWHGIRWRAQKLLDETPWNFEHDPNMIDFGDKDYPHPDWYFGADYLLFNDPEFWVVRGEILPEHFRPVVIREGNEVRVRFCAYSEPGNVYITVHEDCYDIRSQMRNPVSTREVSTARWTLGQQWVTLY